MGAIGNRRTLGSEEGFRGEAMLVTNPLDIDPDADAGAAGAEARAAPESTVGQGTLGGGLVSYASNA